VSSTGDEQMRHQEDDKELRIRWAGFKRKKGPGTGGHEHRSDESKRLRSITVHRHRTVIVLPCRLPLELGKKESEKVTGMAGFNVIADW
jgi:hypothetical protein